MLLVVLAVFCGDGGGCAVLWDGVVRLEVVADWEMG